MLGLLVTLLLNGCNYQNLSIEKPETKLEEIQESEKLIQEKKRKIEEDLQRKKENKEIKCILDSLQVQDYNNLKLDEKKNTATKQEKLCI